MKLGMPITYAADFRLTIANLRDFEAAALDPRASANCCS
jgi:hypothetical protein